MFTGIIETKGVVKHIQKEGTNITFGIESSLSSSFRIDQSVAHNGVCLTVIKIEDSTHYVTAIQETLDKTNLSNWTINTEVNIERCMPAHGRFDGHIVQGHVDCTAICIEYEYLNGSHRFQFKHPKEIGFITVEKGSICVNGISLTVVHSTTDTFEVYIIPYTYEHTNIHSIKVGDKVNLEFDILGKYITKLQQLQA